MALINKISYTIKKSKFIAYYYDVTNKEELKQIWQNLKLEHKKASHIPYAFIFENTGGKSDDKEPSNTAGLPIYYILEQKKLVNKAIFIVRYFGGIKLGAGGLIRAYSNGAKEVIK